MNQQVLVNEPVEMLYRILSDGTVQPTSFVWRDKTRYVDHVGRRWEERITGHAVHCLLIQAVDNTVYEMRWNRATDAWTLYRAWLRDLAV